MVYVLPQVLVYQEFNSVPTEITDPLRACIIGPNADLHRHSDAGEKPSIRVGDYDPDAAQTYDWPGRNAGSTVDFDYVKVFIDDALLQYFADTIGTGSTIAPVAGYKNRIRSNTVNFKSNGEAYQRAAALLDRDVKVGDVAYVRGVVGSDEYELWTYVRSFIADDVAAQVGESYPDDSNETTQAGSSSATVVIGEDGLAPIIDAASYNGLADGDIDETYTVTVTKGSVGGDLTTATVRVRSASGNDDVAAFSPGAVGTTKVVGSRGLEIGWDVDGSNEDLLEGDEYSFVVHQAFEAATSRSGGTYTGTRDTTYIVTVTRGGTFSDDVDTQPQITVTTTHGSDFSGPVGVENDSVAVNVGTKGVTLMFGGTGGSSSSLSGDLVSLDPLNGLRKGDKFYVPVTAKAGGNVRTLVLGHNMPTGMLAATDLDLKLFIKKDIEVAQNRVDAPPQTNWDVEATQITINDGITAYDTSWTDGGVPQPLDVRAGSVYVQYREWMSTLCGDINSMNDVASIDDIPGPLDPDNPLKWGVFKALSNSNGTEVKYIGVCSPDDTDSWIEPLELISSKDDVYNLVALTHNQTVLDAFAAHVSDESSPEAGRWRAMFLPLQAVESVAVVSAATSSDEDVVMATLGDDPDATGTQYTLLTITSGNADLVQLDVAPGDIVRFLYSMDGFGVETYTEFVVDAVVNESEIRLFSGNSTPVTVPQRVEVWHTQTKTELAEALARKAGSYSNRRVCVVWPDSISSGGTEMDAIHLCAGLAGLASGVAPHQGLTNVAISGFDDVSRTTSFFNAAQLNRMAEAGVWIVTADRDGTILTRHAVTSDNTDLNTREEMIRRNVDSISYLFLRRLAQFIGRANVTPTALALIRIQLVSAIEFLKTNGFVPRIGSQLIDGEVTSLSQHAILKDRVVAVLNLTVPAPLNNLEVHLVI